MRTRTLLAPLAGLALVASSLAGCSGTPDDPTVDGRDGATAAAALLADGLGSGSLGDVPLPLDLDADTVQQGYDAVVADAVERLDGVAPEVSLDEDSVAVADAGDTATASLTWRWPFAEGEWAYDAPVRLVRRDDTDPGADPGSTWSVDWSPSVVEPSLAAGDVLDASSLTPARGDILGAGEAPLVTSRRVIRVGLDKPRVRPARQARSARELARLVDVDVAPFVTAVRDAGDRAFVEAIVLRPEDAGGLDARLDAVPGARAIGDRLPLAPTRTFAASLLGRVGQATAEIVEESDGEISAGDEVGLSGLQARYDEQLRGTAGLRVAATSPSGNARPLFTVPGRPGTPLQTTLDERLQRRAEAVLDPVGPPSALVVMRPSTGEVLAAASGPGSDGYTTATFGRYAPGSTFKIVSALALLRAGLTPGSTVSCPATASVDGKQFSNYDDYPAGDLGAIPLRRALASSCNTAFIGRRGAVPRGGLADAAAALGLGVDHDVGFPAYFGEVPPPGSSTEAAADLIGQGTVTASPLAMATVMSSVLAGRTVLPTLVPAVAVEQKPVPAPLRPGEVRSLRAMLRGVVRDGSGRGLTDVPGPPVLAKTGTAEYGTPGPGGDLPTHAWMVAGQGDIAVAAFVEDGSSGSQTAGPLLEQLLRAAR